MPGDPPLELHEAVPLAPLTTLGVGGQARWFTIATQPAQVIEAFDWSRQHDVPLFVLGGGSNIVIAESGFPGLVMRLAIDGQSFEPDDAGVRLVAGAGEPWDDVVAAAVSRGLAGLECLSGIPGTVGGTPIQNVGAYGQDVSESIEAISAFDLSTASVVSFPAMDCGFSYRSSRFKTEPDRFIVLGVTFRLRPGSATVRYPELRARLETDGVAEPTLADVRRAVLALRRSKGMVVDPGDPDSRSVGSFFTNPIVPLETAAAIERLAGQAPPTFAVSDAAVKIPAAWLIERAGFRKGFVDGAAGISTKHPLAIVNRGGATAHDVLRLAVRIKREVADCFGVWLRPEPIFVGFGVDPEVRYLRDEVAATSEGTR